MEEESKAIARFGFGWAISSTGTGGMDVDDDNEGLAMELVWVESEGSFSRSEVSTLFSLKWKGS
jgi:hypothetical protein